MATRNRNRNRTQRRNKNRSRRNRQGGGAASISCNNAQKIVNDPTSGMVKKMAAKVQLKSCGNGMKTVAPNQKWSSMGMRSRRNRRHRGGAASISCDEAAAITADPSKYGIVQRMAAKVQMKSCASGSKNTVAPNQKWSSMGM